MLEKNTSNIHIEYKKNFDISNILQTESMIVAFNFFQ